MQSKNWQMMGLRVSGIGLGDAGPVNWTLDMAYGDERGWCRPGDVSCGPGHVGEVCAVVSFG